MGQILCCCFNKHGDGSGLASTELTPQAAASASSSLKHNLEIDPQRSSSSIEILLVNQDDGKQQNCTVSGEGMAMAGICLDQDTAYWELYIDEVSSSNSSSSDQSEFEALKVGVATDNQNHTYMRDIAHISQGDTIGIAMQQSDLPMIQILINGEIIPHLAVNRFRGNEIYPALLLQKGFKVTFKFHESQWLEQPPLPKFGPLIAARSIV